jgi:hypothetical protein
MNCNQLFQAGSITDVHGFHLWNISAPELAGFQQLLADSHILGTHRHKLPT